MRIIAYVFIGLGLASLLAFCIVRDRYSSKIAIVLKGMTSLFFIGTALFSGLSNANRSANFLPISLTIFGLLFGSVGDIALEFKIYFKASSRPVDSDNMTFVGIGAFALGHICYIISACFLSSGYLINVLYACFCGLACAVLVTFISKHFLHFEYGKFYWPVLFYSFLLSSFVFNSLVMMISRPHASSIMIFIGSLLFIISDLILSMGYFSPKEKYQLYGWRNPESKLFIVINFVTYYLAQYIIAVTLMFI